MREGYTLLEIEHTLGANWKNQDKSKSKFNLNKPELKRQEIFLSANVVLDPSLYNNP